MSFKVIALVLAVAVVVWWLRTPRSTWFALPTIPPTLSLAGWTRRRDPGRSIEHRALDGSAPADNTPAHYVLKGGFVNYQYDDGRLSW